MVLPNESLNYISMTLMVSLICLVRFRLSWVCSLNWNTWLFQKLSCLV